MLYATGRPPVTSQNESRRSSGKRTANIAVTVGEVQSMRLAVYGDGAVMIATEAPPNDASHPSYRAARVWVKRDGQWLMAISAHTDVK